MTNPIQPQNDNAQLVCIDGVVVNIVYRATDGKFAVLQLNAEATNTASLSEIAKEQATPITAVGDLSLLEPGEYVRLHGHWRQDPKFGKQLRVHHWLPKLPATETGLIQYLSSAAVDGVGAQLAERLVSHFGLNIVAVLDDHPQKLCEISGIGRKRAEKISSAWKSKREQRNLQLLLKTHGLGDAVMAKVIKHFGEQALSIVKQTPYRLALEVDGIGFSTADGIAKNQGLAQNDPTRIHAGLLHELAEATTLGHTFLPTKQLILQTAQRLQVATSEVEKAINEAKTSKDIVIDDAGTYLPILHKFEALVSNHLTKFLNQKAISISNDSDLHISQVTKNSAIQLAPAQIEALKLVLHHRFVIITGGPGTGKTTLVQAILQLFKPMKMNIKLAAPTGRAAKRMEETSKHATSTIHRLLEYDPKLNRFQRNQEQTLEVDILILDEVSMLDITLFASVLDALPDDARLILVGDADQLPSVGPGRVLSDLIHSEVMPCVQLTEIFRQAQSSAIVRNAHNINHGRALELPSQKSNQLTDFYVINRKEPAQIIETLLQLVSERIPLRFGLDPKQDIQVLTPMNRGASGAIELNKVLQNCLNPSGPSWTIGPYTYRVGDKVMQTKNNYNLGVFNGEIGIIETLQENKYLNIRFPSGLVTYSKEDLQTIALAYACSIHKAQGSEYPAVIIILSAEHYVMLDRQLLYTAVTRGRQLVIIISSPKSLKHSQRPSRHAFRHSYLAERLRKSCLAISTFQD